MDTRAEAVTRLMVRMNPTLFYCLGAACLLEAVRSAGETPSRAAEPDGPAAAQAQWAHWLRHYVEATWPEFDWIAASAEAVTAVEAPPAGSPHGAAGAALRQAVTALQTSCFYRGLSRWADDPALRARLACIGDAEDRRARACASEVLARRRMDRLDILRGGRCAFVHVRQSRDVTVRVAFELLARHWVGAAPFSPMSYSAFVVRVRRLMAGHVHLTWAQRLVLAAWLATPREPRTRGLSAGAAAPASWDATQAHAIRSNAAPSTS